MSGPNRSPTSISTSSRSAEERRFWLSNGADNNGHEWQLEHGANGDIKDEDSYKSNSEKPWKRWGSVAERIAVFPGAAIDPGDIAAHGPLAQYNP
jgi:hypothetical protein